MSSTATLSRPVDTTEGGTKLGYVEQVEACWAQRNAERQQLAEQQDQPATADILTTVSIEVVALPKCPRTKQTHSERLETTRRAGDRHERDDSHPSRELTPLTPLERLRLHNGTIELKALNGRKLNHCDRKAAKKLKRQRRKAAKKH